MVDRWLVIGATGLVGHHLVEELRRRSIDIVGTSLASESAAYRRLDVRDISQARYLIGELAPTVVAYCTGATGVDSCEADPSVPGLLNAECPGAIAEIPRGECPFVYISSDYVFDGRSGPYDEEAPPRPINVYGRTKLEGEQRVASCPPSLVVRTTVVYGREPRLPGKNSLCQIVDRLRGEDELLVPYDEVGTPTFAADLAEGLVDLVSAGATGLFHLAGRDKLARTEYARLAAEVFGLDGRRIVPVRSKDLHRPARRPLRHGLVSSKAEAILGRQMPGLREGLERALEAWDQ